MVSAYLGIAEFQALNQTPMYMKDCIERLNDFLKLTGKEILEHAGNISHQHAIEKAKLEHQKFKEKTKYELSQAEQDFIKQLESTERNIGKRKM